MCHCKVNLSVQQVAAILPCSPDVETHKKNTSDSSDNENSTDILLRKFLEISESVLAAYPIVPYLPCDPNRYTVATESYGQTGRVL